MTDSPVWFVTGASSGFGRTIAQAAAEAEPGAFRTNLFGAGAAALSAENPAYADTSGGTRRFVEGGDGTQPGDPAKAAAAIRTALAAERTPLRLPLGGDAVDLIIDHLDTVRAELATWEKVSRSTNFDDA